MAAEGDVIRASSYPEVYVIENGQRRWIPDPPTLLSRWNWGMVQVLPDADVLAIPLGPQIPSIIQIAEGDLIKANSQPDVFLVENGRRRWIPDPPTLLSRWNWGMVKSVPDAHVFAIPLGIQIPSVIQAPAYPDGALLVGSGPEVYVIEGGQRRWVPDPATFNALGFDWNSIQRIPDSQLNAIPLGQPLPKVQVLQAQVETDLKAGHFMTTGVTLRSDTGVLDAITRTRTVTWFGGFTGGVVVILGGANGAAIGKSGLHTFGVDGTWIGQSDRTEHWTENIDPALAGQARTLGVIHAWTPKVDIEQAIQDGLAALKTIAEIIAVIVGIVGAGGGAGGGEGGGP